MSDLNMPSDESDDHLHEVESSEERLREDIGLPPEEEGAGDERRSTRDPTRRTPPPPD